MAAISTDSTQIAVIGKNALAEMVKRAVPLHPTNYSVWFEYCEGQNADLVVDMNRLLKSGVPLSNELHDYLFNKYFVNKHNREVALRAAGEMHGVLSSILAKLLSLARFSTQYQEKLVRHSAQFRQAQSLSEVQNTIDQLILDTNGMADSTAELQLRLQEERARAETLRALLEQTKRDALSDGLTGLYNRKALDCKLEEMLDEHRQSKAIFSMLMLDIDLFKTVNDTYGHAVGDAVLRVVAGAITQQVKGADFAARYGGEEFVLLLPKTTMEKGIVVAENVRGAIETVRLKVKKTNEPLPSITISAGVAEVRPGDTAQTLLARADQALYAAKRAGRNLVKAAV